MNLRDQLQVIYEEHGKLTPAIVVDVARDEAHPLHERFEWDDVVAGEKWREVQAHRLITTVRVSYRRANDTEGDVRAFHAIRAEDGFQYKPVAEITADPILTELLRRDMEREWRSLKARYEMFEEFRELVVVDLGVVAA